MNYGYGRQGNKWARIAMIAGIVALVLCVACYGVCLFGKWKMGRTARELAADKDTLKQIVSLSIDDMEAVCDFALDAAKETENLSPSELWSGLKVALEEASEYADVGVSPAAILVLYFALKLRIPLLILGLALLALALYLKLRESGRFAGMGRADTGDPTKRMLARVAGILGILALVLCMVCYGRIGAEKQKMEMLAKVPELFFGYASEVPSTSKIENEYDKAISAGREEALSWTEAVSSDNGIKDVRLYLALKARTPLLILGLVLLGAAVILKLWAGGIGSASAPRTAPQPKTAANLFCGSCGKQLTRNTGFCPYCGASIRRPAPAPQPVPARRPAPAPQPAPAPRNFCPNCGKEMAPNAAFCPNCGASASGKRPSAPQPVPARRPAPARKAAPALQPAPMPTDPSGRRRCVMCPNCGRIYSSWQSSCSCGRPLPNPQEGSQQPTRTQPLPRTNLCPQCGQENPADALFCSHCRQPLKGN